jgi:hypothetical protein
MSRDPLRLGDYLGHILDAIKQIQNYCIRPKGKSRLINVKRLLAILIVRVITVAALLI